MDDNQKRGCITCAVIGLVFLAGCPIMCARFAKSAHDEYPHSFQIYSVLGTMEKSPRRFLSDDCQSVDINGGVGVIVGGLAAYWVGPDGRVYHANGHAKAFSPRTPQAPVGIGMQVIEDAIGVVDAKSH